MIILSFQFWDLNINKFEKKMFLIPNIIIYVCCHCIIVMRIIALIGVTVSARWVGTQYNMLKTFAASENRAAHPPNLCRVPPVCWESCPAPCKTHQITKLERSVGSQFSHWKDLPFTLKRLCHQPICFVVSCDKAVGWFSFIKSTENLAERVVTITHHVQWTETTSGCRRWRR